MLLYPIFSRFVFVEGYQVSARKYRPQSFDSVVGQSSVTSTLKNAIASDKLAQAFLFCGPRGVGKTTCSRILAKTINCEQISDQTEACDSCVSCKAFKEGTLLNIFELDAASNNSVDDIRSLIDQVQYPPQQGKYKVYIIDEVHMLSTAAFNAFLKTLEEPPSYAIFILATTEKHKILPTILSRCQIYDFKRITPEDMANHLQEIAVKESIQADKEALKLIAQKADGALRDALSLFDQLAMFTEQNISYKAVVEHLNILDHDYFVNLTNAFIQCQIPEALMLLNQIIEKGFNLPFFLEGLATHFRNLMVASDPSTVTLLQISESYKKAFSDQAQQLTPAQIFSMLELVNQSYFELKTSSSQRLTIEILLMKLSSILSQDEKKKSTPKLKILSPQYYKAALEQIQSVDIEKKQILQEPESTPNTPHKKEISSSVTSQTSSAKIESEEHVQIDALEQENIVSKQSTYGVKTLSLQEVLKPIKKEKTEEMPSDKVKRSKAFSEDEFYAAWAAYLEELKQKAKKNLWSILSQKPELKENTIYITLSNSALKQELETEKAELLFYLRERLKNDLITLVDVVKAKENTAMLYTSKDRYEMLVEKYPQLKTFKETLNLELEI